MNHTIQIVLAFLLSISLSSCVTLKNVQQQNIQDRQVEFTTAGTGNPTIVLETGMGPTIDTWAPIFDSLAAISSTFAYNRPGYGNSGLKNPPRSVKEVARQLHDNLEATGQKPPYLLVGHSAGGLYIHMFARLYPEEVAGLVFLDASHPGQFEYFRQHQQLIYTMLITATTKGSRKYEESIVKNTQSDFEIVPPFPKIPVTVLTAGKKSSFMENDEMRAKWLEFQKELAELSEDSRHIIVEGSGHYVHKDKPGLVISEIKRIISSK